MNTGQKGAYFWVELKDLFIHNLLSSIPAIVLSKYLLITALDSGPLALSDEEQQQGWLKIGDLALSPPIKNIQLPSGGYDEWYLFSSPPDLSVGHMEVFVNDASFTLLDPNSRLDHMEPTWDKSLAKSQVDHEVELQRRFWDQLQAMRPETFIADGDRLIFITRNKQLFREVCQQFL